MARGPSGTMDWPKGNDVLPSLAGGGPKPAGGDVPTGFGARNRGGLAPLNSSALHFQKSDEQATPGSAHGQRLGSSHRLGATASSGSGVGGGVGGGSSSSGLGGAMPGPSWGGGGSSGQQLHIGKLPSAIGAQPADLGAPMTAHGSSSSSMQPPPIGGSSGSQTARQMRSGGAQQVGQMPSSRGSLTARDRPSSKGSQQWAVQKGSEVLGLNGGPQLSEKEKQQQQQQQPQQPQQQHQQQFQPFQQPGGPFGSSPASGSAPATAPAAQKSGRLSFGRRGSISQANPPGTFMPIRELSTYSGNRWQIRARVITKGDIRKFNSTRGEGQLCKVDLKDESGEISATFFGKAVDAFYAMLQPGQVYSFARGYVKAANPRFDKGQFVITFEESSIIEPVVEETAIPGVTYEFKSLADLESLPVNTLVDVKAVVFGANDAFTFTAKSGREMTKKEIGLWDPSGEGGHTVDMTLWGERAAGTQVSVGSVVFLKDCRVSEWQGAKTLNSPASIEVDPSDPQAAEIKAQYEASQRVKPVMRAVGGGGGGSGGEGARGRRQSFLELKQEDLALSVQQPGMPLDPNTRTVYRHTAIGTVTGLPTERSPMYPACPALVDKFQPATQAANGPPEQRMCQKKCQEEEGVWRCGAGHTCQQPRYRYIGRAQVMDYSDSCEVNFFDEVGKKLYGCDAEQLQVAWDQEGPEEINRRLLWRKVALKLRSSKEIWQESERVRVNVDEVSEVDLKREGRALLAEVTASLAAMGQSC
uniref:Replication protein A 70 kDa DNA-binding subunit n=1 Tax=Crypthecodinium cohnii TaxID=2866 RepID=A0A516AGW7_CRYCO|nr:replication protein A 70 kDa DNA-binding subunit [Crypthecodinium cohnii]